MGEDWAINPHLLPSSFNTHQVLLKQENFMHSGLHFLEFENKG
jgi:hypothetical protein